MDRPIRSEDHGGFGHEVNAAENDEPRLAGGGNKRELRRITHLVGNLLSHAGLITVGEDERASLAPQLLEPDVNPLCFRHRQPIRKSREGDRNRPLDALTIRESHIAHARPTLSRCRHSNQRLNASGARPETAPQGGITRPQPGTRAPSWTGRRFPGHFFRTMGLPFLLDRKAA